MTGMPFDHPTHPLPGTLPIFPLAGVLLLPRGRLPLHIFEPRYVAMLEDALAGDRLIGMIQPLDPACRDPAPVLYPVGCAGRISAFRDLEDGRYLVTLTGLSRFRIGRELEEGRGYRRVEPVWHEFADDLTEIAGPPFERTRLLEALPCYFEAHEIVADWDSVRNAPDERLVTSLAMICPLAPNEKQALLEAATLPERAQLLTSLVEMAVDDAKRGGRCVCH